MGTERPTVGSEASPKENKSGRSVDLQRLVRAITQAYANSADPIYYVNDPVIRRFASRQTIDRYLTLAQETQVVPIPMYRGKNSYYPRDEFITAMEFGLKLRELGARRPDYSRTSQRPNKESKLTGGETARRLGMTFSELKRCISEGKISLGNPSLNESIQRLTVDSQATHRLINRSIVERLEAPLLVERLRFPPADVAQRKALLERLPESFLEDHPDLITTVDYCLRQANLPGDFSAKAADLDELLETYCVSTRIVEVDQENDGVYKVRKHIIMTSEKALAILALHHESAAPSLSSHQINKLLEDAIINPPNNRRARNLLINLSNYDFYRRHTGGFVTLSDCCRVACVKIPHNHEGHDSLIKYLEDAGYTAKHFLVDKVENGSRYLRHYGIFLAVDKEAVVEQLKLLAKNGLYCG